MKVQPQNHICIQGGHVFDPSQGLDSIMDIFIENDTIVALGEPPVGFTAGETIDASGQYVFPGFVDLNAFLAEPGYTHKGSISSETQAAAHSGFTTVCSTPNSNPVVDSSTLVNLIQDKAKQAGFCQVAPIGAITPGLNGEQLSNMFALKDAGCIALSNHNNPFKDSHVIKQCYHYAAGFDITVMVTPLDTALANKGNMHEGATSTRLGLTGIPVSAETASLAQHLILAEETGVRLHVSRITSARALEMILAAQQQGMPVTADVALANLLFTDEHCQGYDSLMHVQPVLRSEHDRQALLAGVNAGQLAICSNHQPHDIAAKMAPFEASEAGISVLDSFSSVLFDLVSKKELTLNAAIGAISNLPGAILNTNAGQIKIEGRADLCIANLDESQQLNTTDLISKGHNNPWLGQTLQGKVHCTLHAGQVVFKR